MQVILVLGLLRDFYLVCYSTYIWHLHYDNHRPHWVCMTQLRKQEHTEMNNDRKRGHWKAQRSVCAVERVMHTQPLSPQPRNPKALIWELSCTPQAFFFYILFNNFLCTSMSPRLIMAVWSTISLPTPSPAPSPALDHKSKSINSSLQECKIAKIW